jgi:iron complex transport system ATP-binding protein
MTDIPTLSAQNLTVGYERRGSGCVSVLKDINAQLKPGQFTFLLGPNGAGKSTLLRTLVGSQKPLGGKVVLGSDDLARLSARERARRLSVVLTDPVDVGLMTVRTLVGLGRAPHVGWFSSMADDDRETVEWALVAAGALDLAERQVIELSDGERQRSMIARALAQRPSVLILDEPTAFLDLTRRVELTALLRRLATESGVSVLMSTHDLDLALRTADQLWLVHGDGRFEVGGPEDLGINGAIARAYAGRGIVFDHAAGTFVLTRDNAGPCVSVSASHLEKHWAARAVHRAGFIPVADSVEAPWRLTLNSDAQGELSWRLNGSGTTHQGQGLGDLVGKLKDLNNKQPTIWGTEV